MFPVGFILPALALVGAGFIVRRASAAEKKKAAAKKKKAPSSGAPPEPTEPGAGVVWSHAYYTLGIEKSDGSDGAAFHWGVFDTRGLRSIAAPASPDGKPSSYDPEAFDEAQQAGYEYGFGSADTYAEAVAEAQLWAETIREPLRNGETLATVVAGNLIVVSSRTPEVQQTAAWVAFVFDAAAWPNWAAGQLPGPTSAGWSIMTKTQDEALGQAVLYARRHPADGSVGSELGVGASTANSGVQLRWSGTPGSSSLIAIGQNHGPAKAHGGTLRVGARTWHPRARLFGGTGPRTPTRQRAVRRLLAPGALPLPQRPSRAPRWPGDVVLWFHQGFTLAIELGDTPGPSQWTWARFDTATLRATGWNLRAATDRGGRLAVGYAPRFSIAVDNAQASARRARLVGRDRPSFTSRGF